jgi:hypothetical protein
LSVNPIARRTATTEMASRKLPLIKHFIPRLGQILDQSWKFARKYTGQPGPYALRDPKIDKKRVLFVCGIDRIATFGEP